MFVAHKARQHIINFVRTIYEERTTMTISANFWGGHFNFTVADFIEQHKSPSRGAFVVVENNGCISLVSLIALLGVHVDQVNTSAI